MERELKGVMIASVNSGAWKEELTQWSTVFSVPFPIPTPQGPREQLLKPIACVLDLLH